MVAGVTADTLTKQLLDSREERRGARQIQAIESVIGSLQATGQRRYIVRLRSLDVLLSNLSGPEVMRFECLSYTVCSEICIYP
jgi:hypothetical protein